jgi:MFS family permease
MNKRVFMALFLAVFAAQLGIGIIAPLMHLFSERTGASGLWLGIMFSAFSLSRLMFMPFTGRLSDLRGRRKLMISGLLAYTVISFCYALTTNIYMLTSIRFLHGLASCMVTPLAQAYIGELIPKGKEGAHINLFAMSIFLGMGFGPFLGGVLTSAFYINAAFYAMVGLSALALSSILLFMPADELSPKGGNKAGTAPLKTVLGDNRIKAMLIFRASRGFWRQGIVAFLPFLAIGTMKMNEAEVGLLLSAFLITGGTLQGLVGPLLDRFNKTVLIVACSIIGPALIFLIPYMHDGKMLLAVLLPMASLGAVARGSALALNVELGREHNAMGTVIGTFNSAGGMGMMAGPIAFGFVMDYFGINTVFAVGAVIGLAGAFATVYFLTHK